MASYPTSVWGPTTKNAGDTIQPSHINDAQSEIVAMEQALVTGPITLPNSTIANVSVTGGSTLAGLHVTSTASFDSSVTFNQQVSFAVAPAHPTSETFSSGLSVSTGIIRQDALPAWSVFSSAVSVIGAGSSAGFNFDGQDFVRGNIGASTSANSSRVTVNSTGLYYVCARAAVDCDSADVSASLYVRFNDASTNVLTAKAMSPTASALRMHTLVASGVVRVASSGYFTVSSSNSKGSTWGATDPGLAIRFSGHFIG